jgi:hypothetical protein
MSKEKFNNTSVIACNQVLFHYRQKSDQSLSEFMDQLMLMMSNAKINSENNLFFTMFFISILFTGEFQEKCAKL